MGEQLFDRLSGLRRQVRSLVWIHGASWLMVALFASTLTAGSLDWLLKLDDPGIRLLLGLSIIGLTGWVGWRYLWRPLRVRLSNVELATRIERCHPALADSLSSTVQFLECEQDQRIGSPTLQREVIRRTLSRLKDVSVEGVLETKPVQRSALSAILACAVAALVVGFHQAEAATAISRLLFPFSKISWPRNVELRFVSRDLSPLPIAAEGSITVVEGETLELYVENQRGPLPDDLVLISRRADGRTVTESMRQTTLWDQDGRSREIGGASLTITQGPLSFQAKGGDGETIPIEVEVVPPPQIRSLRLTLEPPAYLAQPTRNLPENTGHIEGYVGTRVSLRATANKPLSGAKLLRSDGVRKDETALGVSPDGLTIDGQLVLTQPGHGTWWLQLIDQQGFENPDAPRYDIRVTADSIPTVVIEDPDSDRTVTSTAKVPFRVSARDDLGLTGVDLVWQVESAQNASGIPNENSAPGSGSATPAPVTTAVSTGIADGHHFRLFDSSTPGTDTNPPDAKQRVLNHVWDLAPHAFAPGTKIVVTAEARDACSIGEPHVGHSLPRSLVIVDPEQKRAELQDRQGALVLELERASAMQQKARDFTRELNLQLEKTGTLRPEDIDLLKRVELDQKQVESRLTDTADGLEQRARSIRQERADNDVQDATSSTLLDGLIEELKYLRQEPLPEIERRLSEARKLAASEFDESGLRKQLSEALATAARRQDEAGEALEKQLLELSRWKSDRNLNADLRSLSGEQEQLAEASKQLGQQTLTRPFSSLTAQEKADLERLAARQRQMADRLDQFQESLKTAAEELRTPEPDRAEAIQQALDQMEQSGVSGDMRQTADDLRQNRIGEALRSQQEIAEEMRKLQDQLDQRDITDTEALVKQLNETGQQLTSLKQQQSDLMQKLNDAQALPEAEREPALQQLRKEQEQLRRQTEETLRRLKRLQSPAARAAERAGQRMQQAEQELSENDSDGAQAEAQEALDDLEQAERELAQDQRQAEEQLAREALEKMADQLKSLVARQEAAIVETQRLKTEYDASGKWSRTLLKSLRNLADIQSGLKDETNAAADRVEEIPAVAIALRGAVRRMEQALQRFEERDVTDDTAALQEQARIRLAGIVAALSDPAKDSAAGADQQPDDSQPQDGPQESSPEGDRFPIIAQLQIILELQEDLIARGDALRKKEADGADLTDADQQELAAMAGEQAQLADLIRELTALFGDPEEPAPEAESSTPDATAPRDKSD